MAVRQTPLRLVLQRSSEAPRTKQRSTLHHVGPSNTSKFEMTSIPATIKNLFGLPTFLTKRDAWAGSFHELLLGTPRADTPEHLPDAPPPTQNVPTQHGCGSADEATRRQKRHHSLLSQLLGEDEDDDDGDEVEEDDDEGPQLPLLGENSFLVTKGFPAMKDAIARKAQKLLDQLEQGTLHVPRDEL